MDFIIVGRPFLVKVSTHACSRVVIESIDPVKVSGRRFCDVRGVRNHMDVMWVCMG